MGMMDGMGFSGDPRKWLGKTIVAAEQINMQYGSIGQACLLFKFEDGSRGWVVGRVSDGLIVGPDVDALEKSRIITADEYGALVANRKREIDAREEDRKRQKRQEYERLKQELGE